MSDYWQFPQNGPHGDDQAQAPDTDAAPSRDHPPSDDRRDREYEHAASAATTSSPPDGAASATPPPPPPPWSRPPQYAPPARLYRSRSRRLVGGVAGGVARHLGVDPLLIRFATVLVLMSGLGIFAYIAAWILLPLEPLAENGQPVSARTRPPRPKTSMEQFKSALAIGAVAIGLGIALNSFTFVALWLIGGGIWLLSQQPKPVLAQAQQAMNSALLDTPQQRKVPLSDQDRHEWRRQYEWEAERYGWPDIGDTPVDVMVPVPARPRQTITRLVLSLLLLLLAIGTAASAGDWWDVRLTRMLGIALVTVGAGVVLGAGFRNRARGLIPVGLLLAVAMVPAAAVSSSGGGFDGFIDGVGVRAAAPTTVAMLSSSYELSIGELTLDFSELDLAGESRTVDVNVAAGELRVVLPPNIGGSVSIEASVGEIAVELANDGRDRWVLEGLNIDTGELPMTGSNGELFLNIKASVGDIEVTQAES